LLALDRVAEAEPELLAALKFAPDLAPARIDLAQTQATLGRYPAAAATLEQHLARHPDDFQARHGLGRLLLAAGRSAEAAAVFRRVLADAPDHADARDDLARLSAIPPLLMAPGS
jgi:Flp pilus assembly protein TadD